MSPGGSHVVTRQFIGNPRKLGSDTCVAWRQFMCRQTVSEKSRNAKRTRAWQGHTPQAFHTIHIHTIKIKTRSGTPLI